MRSAVLTGRQWSQKTHSRGQGGHQLARWAGALMMPSTVVTQRAPPSYKGTLLYHSWLGPSGSAVRLQRGWDSSVEGHGRRVCNRRASAWQDQRPGEKGATARQALILHPTWKQKEKVSSMQSPSVPGLQVNSAVTVPPLLGCPSMRVRLGRWADGLKLALPGHPVTPAPPTQ